MDEYVIKQKIQKTCFEPRAPEALIQQVILRTHAVAMGVEEQPAYQAALRGGNVARRLSSGELIQQIVEQAPAAGQEAPGVSSPKKDGPTRG